MTEQLVKQRGFWANILRKLLRNKLAIFSFFTIILLVLLCILIPIFSSIPFDKTNFNMALQSPNSTYWFGTDSLGRDIFVRVFLGGRVTFIVAFLATVFVMLFGVLYGSLAGFLGGKIDNIMMRIVDVLYGIPLLFFCILLITVFGNSFMLSLVAIAAISWLDMSRVVRGQTLSIKSKEFIEAAHLSGLSKWNIIKRHIIPNLFGVVVVYVMLTLPSIIITSAVLSFFGLGITEPNTSWGLLISDGAQNLESWWLLLFPAGLMVTTLLLFAVLANAVRDALDMR